MYEIPVHTGILTKCNRNVENIFHKNSMAPVTRTRIVFVKIWFPVPFLKTPYDYGSQTHQALQGHQHSFAGTQQPS